MIVSNELNFKKFLNEEINLTSMLSPEIGNDSGLDKQSTDRFNISSVRSLILPTKTVTSQIRLLNDKSNPILIQLADGTKIYLTYDEYQRIKNQNPEVGKKISVEFQRNPTDKSDNYSMINSIKIF
jgi:hypothetical protein